MSKPFRPPLTTNEVRSHFPTVQIVNQLSAGGQGALFVIDFNGQKAALKLYNDAYLTRAERECIALTNLRSQNVVQLYGWGTVHLRGRDCIYAITEFVEGNSLREIINRRVLDEDEARKLGIGVTKAISDLWSLDKIVHRDLKPENIMIKPDGTAIVLDLGIARHTELTTVTPFGFAPGTPGYMSPEQARGRRGLTFKSDFFALGIVQYESVSQEHPFQFNQGSIGLIVPQPVIGIAPVTNRFSRIVQSLLKRHPLDRPRDCKSLIEELRQNN